LGCAQLWDPSGFVEKGLFPEWSWELPNIEEGGGPAGVKDAADEGGGPAGVVVGLVAKDSLLFVPNFVPGVEGGLEE
jgi:hypothetical protein